MVRTRTDGPHLVRTKFPKSVLASLDLGLLKSSDSMSWAPLVIGLNDTRKEHDADDWGHLAAGMVQTPKLLQCYLSFVQSPCLVTSLPPGPPGRVSGTGGSTR